MKKILSILAFLLIVIVKANADDVVWTEVSTVDEFRAAISANANVKLTADIDLTGVSSTKDVYIFEAFTGRLTGENSLGNDYAIKNSTYPLFYHLSGATISHVIIENFTVSDATSLIARTSSGGTFSHVTVTNSTLTTNDVGDNVGMVCGYSDGDNFEYCFVDEGCSVTSVRKRVAGIVGDMVSTGTVSYCHNAAQITSSDDNTAGVVGYIKKGTIDHCVNTGKITGGDYVAGIVGFLNSGTISACVNTGEISGYTSNVYLMSGIVANNDDDITISNCFNYGAIGAMVASYATPINGCTADVTKTNCYYYCQFEGSHTDNLSSMGTSYEKIMSGEFAYANGYYQDMDSNTFTTYYPVPLADAGTVYPNVLCDGTTSYSNTYQSTASHSSVADGYGRCSVCGNALDDVPATIAISDAAGLRKLSYAVNNGTDYSNSTITLTDDIDMSGEDFTVIGTYPDYPFKGTFNGNGHRIKNLHITNSNAHRSVDNGVGFFGCVAGTTVIDGLIIDSTSTVASRHTGTAAIVGCIALPSTSSTDAISFTMKNCGNEAAVSGDGNLAGLVGGVYNTDGNSNVKITLCNCYNSADIMGVPDAATGMAGTTAAFIGYGNNTISASNCLNTGYIKGWHKNYALINYASNATVTSSNIYNVITAAQDKTETTTLQTNQVTLGDACLKLNATRGTNTDWSIWAQDLATDSHPTFGDAGLHYTRTMANQWGTICLPYTAATGDGYDFYKLTAVTDDALTLEKVTAPVAGTPYIIRRGTSVAAVDIPANGSTIATSPVAGSSASGLTLTGAYTSTDITDQSGYIIANNSFWNIASIKGENKVNCAPFRAWLSGSISSSAKQLTIGLGEDLVSTAVDVLDAETSGTAEYYDINGRKLSDLQQGVNIVKMNNGQTKTVILK